MDSNCQMYIFLAHFPLNPAHVMVAPLVINVSPIVLYPFLRLVEWFELLAPPKYISPRNLGVESASNSRITQVNRPYRIVACRKVEGSLYA